ncbi:MAG TPA: tetratricopeptide repeat protein [Anaerolinea sp.]|nr:tetratricopeptide repeat protein [Anaerolinea sp.]
MEASFGNWIRRRRKGLDLTQDELARRIGCSSSLIFKMETDERRPSRQIAELLATHLEIPKEQRELFLSVARQEQSAIRLDTPDPLVLPVSVGANPRVRSEPIENSESPSITLPVFATAFIGREHEVDILSRQILDPACRLLTLTGPGGVGKTRLAVEVARHVDKSFLDGVHFLAMAGVNPADSILPVIADALGIIFSGPADPALQVIQVLRKKSMLLVFDNMEHLIASSPILGEILEKAPGVRILLTSREAVHLQWEWIFEVQGLPVPEIAQPGVLESNSATMLFMERTRQTAQTTPPNAEGVAAIVQICRLVDGLPLAIELAASWSRVMSPNEIAVELASGLDLLETSLQDVSPRHRSIRLVFDHSWKLLSGDERAALMNLAVFPGGFTREVAQSAVGASVRLLSALVSKSLLRFGKKAGRYDFHELVRQYVLEQLDKQPDLEQSAYARQTEYFARWLADLEAPLKSAQQIQISAQIRVETANWSAAWRWSAQQQRLDLLVQMTPCLYWYIEIHGDNAEGLASYSYVVDELRKAGSPGTLRTDAEISTFAMLVTQLGWFEFRLGNIERAVMLYTECLPLLQRLEAPDQYALYLVYVNWGYLALVTGDAEDAGRLMQKSLVHAHALNSSWCIAVSVNILGIVEFQRGNLEAAYQQLNDSLTIWREIGDLRGLVFCMLYLSSTALALGDFNTVEKIITESNAIAEQKLDRWAHAFGLGLLGHVAHSRGQTQEARQYFQQSLDLSRKIGDQLAATQALIHLGEVHLTLGDRPEAQRLFRQAYANAQQAGWVSVILELLVASIGTLDGTLPVDTKLTITLAVLEHSAATLAIRQRCERLKNEYAAALHPQQVDITLGQAKVKPAEEWARVLFQHSHEKDGRLVGSMPETVIEISQTQ